MGNCWEYDACFVLEDDPDIGFFEPQPVGFKYEEFGRIGTYTPDFLLTLRPNKAQKYIEVKYKKHTLNPVFQDLFKCKQTKAQELGYDLESMTEEDIRKEPYLSNLKLLHYYHTSSALDDLDYLILEQVEGQHEVIIGKLPAIVGAEKNYCIPKVYNLLANKLLSANIVDHSLNAQTSLSLAAQ